MLPKVSVIVPNYNHASYLEQRIQSILSQTYQDFEVILMDDCSTDKSVAILEKYARHPKVSALLLNERNSGGTFRQWKKGIEHARGKYIWIAESDDYADPLFLQYLVPLLEKGCSLAYCRSFRVEGTHVDTKDYFWPDALDPQKWRRNYINDGKNEIKGYMIYRNTVPNASACVFVRSSINIAEDILNMRYCGDWLFWIRIIQGSKVGFISKKLNYFRMHPGTTRKKIPLEQVKNKFKEYILAVKEARSMASSGGIKLIDVKQYDWILLELIKVTDKKVYYPVVSILPLPLLLRYFLLLSRHKVSF